MINNTKSTKTYVRRSACSITAMKLQNIFEKFFSGTSSSTILTPSI